MVIGNWVINFPLLPAPCSLASSPVTSPQSPVPSHQSPKYPKPCE
ncbi:hypothetical protein [Sphaerospermopsis aphanizomenoides]|nr:hypothetical protein [Sphaerospermopsis aphanizomenoides]